MPRAFVIQEHWASTHHFDFRLERQGVYKSWALPKGMPTKNGIARLAMETADHDLAFGQFEGTMPKGQYGAGEIRIWDKGTYQEMTWTTNLIRFRLSGSIAAGNYTLRKVPRIGVRAWLLTKT